jgi:hypothetical protein
MNFDLNSFMWLYEILTPARVLTATTKFRDTFKTFRKIHAGLEQTLRDFIEFRLTHRPDEAYGAKDTAFVSRELRGFRHFHMVHGRVILIYRLTPTELRLCLVMDHNYSTKQGQTSLGNYLNNPNISYDALAPERPSVTLSKQQLDAISQLFFEYAAEDRAGLVHAISDDLSDLMDFIRHVIDAPWSNDEKDRATLTAYGGVEGLRQEVKRVLQQTAVRPH